MPRHEAAVVDLPEWISASPHRPCPICGGITECSRLEDEQLVRCCNTVSDRPLLPDGWLHRLTGQPHPM